jgi:hypothetical protein
MALRSLVIPQRTSVDFPTQIVSTSLGNQNYSMQRANANELGGDDRRLGLDGDE